MLGALDDLLYQPLTTPEQWCDQRPCVDLGGLTLAEPWSSLLVFALATLWIVIGVAFVVTRAGQRSRAWFGASLILGGIAAGAAGLSYQAFSYDLKCADREYCVLTNGFEVTYSVVQAVSASAMVVAIGYACARPRTQRALLLYATLNVVVYLVITALGVMLPSATLLSFEVLMLFAVPAIIISAVLAASHMRSHHDVMSRRILIAVILLVLVQVLYFGYYALGLTATLWSRGIYFSANDVLHLGMLIWLGYVYFGLRRSLGDAVTNE